MKGRIWALAFLLVGVLVLLPAQSMAELVGLNIEVFKNGISQGTAFGGASTSTNTPFVVYANTGDTLRFVVMLSFDPVNNTSSYNTTLTVDSNNAAGGGAEMKFVAGSGVELSGIGFAGFNGNPNNSLNDTSPTVGNGSSSFSSGGVDSINLYRVDFIVQTVVNNALPDFTVEGIPTGNYTSVPIGDLYDTSKDTASVRVDTYLMPEPSSFLLLVSGLAGLGLWRRKRE